MLLNLLVCYVPAKTQESKFQKETNPTPCAPAMKDITRQMLKALWSELELEDLLDTHAHMAANYRIGS